ncbi:hypothetical protein C0J52_25855, partial [Blattella germanica]
RVANIQILIAEDSYVNSLSKRPHGYKLFIPCKILKCMSSPLVSKLAIIVLRVLKNILSSQRGPSIKVKM